MDVTQPQRASGSRSQPSEPICFASSTRRECIDRQNSYVFCWTERIARPQEDSSTLPRCPIDTGMSLDRGYRTQPSRAPLGTGLRLRLAQPAAAQLSLGFEDRIGDGGEM